MNITELKKACIAKVNESFDKADAFYGKPMPRCPVEFNSRMTSCGGVARSMHMVGEKHQRPIMIELSLPLLKLNGQAFIDEVPAHEVAHLVDGYHHNGRGHGRTWQRVMRQVMKLDTGRTHKLITPEKKSRRTESLQCKCPAPHTVTPHLYNKVKNGARYKCRVCSSPLHIKGEIIRGVSINNVQLKILNDEEYFLLTHNLA